MFRRYRLKNYNFKLVLNVFILEMMGLVFIHSADSSYVFKQALGITLCTVIMVGVSLIDFNYFLRNDRLWYILNIILLLGVKFFGKDVNGAKRWFSLGPIGTFQVSELSKIVMILVVAVYVAKHEYEMDDLKCLGKLAAICAVPLYLIKSQPDLSTTVDIFLMIAAIVFVGGLSAKFVVRVVCYGVPIVVFLLWYVQTPGQILLQDHQLARIMSFLNPEAYANSTALQTSNSIMAIGSGGLFGKGFGANTISNVTTSTVNLVSEQQTDFIFSVIGEEFGFLGCLVVIACFIFLVFQCINIARKTEILSARLVAIGIASYFAFQSFINIGVATGTLPNTGLPLPFISYGISSLMSASIGIGIMLNIDLQNTKY